MSLYIEPKIKKVNSIHGLDAIALRVLADAIDFTLEHRDDEDWLKSELDFLEELGSLIASCSTTET